MSRQVSKQHHQQLQEAHQVPLIQILSTNNPQHIFESILSPVTPEHFFNQYFGSQPFILQKHSTSYFDKIFDPTEFLTTVNSRQSEYLEISAITSSITAATSRIAHLEQQIAYLEANTTPNSPVNPQLLKSIYTEYRNLLKHKATLIRSYQETNSLPHPFEYGNDINISSTSYTTPNTDILLNAPLVNDLHALHPCTRTRLAALSQDGTIPDDKLNGIIYNTYTAITSKQTKSNALAALPTPQTPTITDAAVMKQFFTIVGFNDNNILVQSNKVVQSVDAVDDKSANNLFAIDLDFNNLLHGKSIQDISTIFEQIAAKKAYLNSIVNFNHLLATYRAGCAITISRPHISNNVIWNLLYQLECYFHTILKSEVTILPAFNHGIAKRFNPHHTFILQLSGSTNINIFTPLNKPSCAHTQLTNDRTVPSSALFNDPSIMHISDIILSHALHAGDILYLPPHFVHELSAVSPSHKNTSKEQFFGSQQESIFMVLTLPQQNNYQALTQRAADSVIAELSDSMPALDKNLPLHYDKYLGAVNNCQSMSNMMNDASFFDDIDDLYGDFDDIPASKLIDKVNKQCDKISAKGNKKETLPSKQGKKGGEIESSPKLDKLSKKQTLNDFGDMGGLLGDYDTLDEIPDHIKNDTSGTSHRKLLSVGNVNPEVRASIRKLHKDAIFSVTTEFCNEFVKKFQHALHMASDQLQLEFATQRLPQPPNLSLPSSTSPDNDYVEFSKTEKIISSLSSNKTSILGALTCADLEAQCLQENLQFESVLTNIFSTLTPESGVRLCHPDHLQIVQSTMAKEATILSTGSIPGAQTVNELFEHTRLDELANDCVCGRMCEGHVLYCSQIANHYELVPDLVHKPIISMLQTTQCLGNEEEAIITPQSTTTKRNFKQHQFSIAILPLLAMLTEEYPRLVQINDLTLDWAATRSLFPAFAHHLPMALVHQLKKYDNSSLFDDSGFDSSEDDSKRRPQDSDSDSDEEGEFFMPSERYQMLYRFWAVCELFRNHLIEIVPENAEETNQLLADEGFESDEDDLTSDIFKDIESNEMCDSEEEFDNDTYISPMKKGIVQQQLKPPFSKNDTLMDDDQDEIDNYRHIFASSSEGELGEYEGEFDPFEGELGEYEGEFDPFEGEFDPFEGEECDFYDVHDLLAEEECDDEIDDGLFDNDSSDQELTAEEQALNEMIKSRYHKANPFLSSPPPKLPQLKRVQEKKENSERLAKNQPEKELLIEKEKKQQGAEKQLIFTKKRKQTEFIPITEEIVKPLKKQKAQALPIDSPGAVVEQLVKLTKVKKQNAEEASMFAFQNSAPEKSAQASQYYPKYSTKSNKNKK